MKSLGVLGLDELRAREIAAIEAGRYLCRDITGTEPERMAPLRIAALVEEAFAGTGVAVTVERDVSAYPLITAVARASMAVERHKPCVVTLEYRPEGEITRTVIVCGKGVTYDTGGADLKTDGHMAGMSRDKGGAGAAAGLLLTVAGLKIPGVRVIALLGLVRNSIGEESFVSDEIIRSRAGQRVRIGNTDAEAASSSPISSPAPGDRRGRALARALLAGHAHRPCLPRSRPVHRRCRQRPCPRRRPRGSARRPGRALGRALGEEPPAPRGLHHGRPALERRRRGVRQPPGLGQHRARPPDPVCLPRHRLWPARRAAPFIHVDIAGTAVENADWQFGRPTGIPIATLTAYLARAGR